MDTLKNELLALLKKARAGKATGDDYARIAATGLKVPENSSLNQVSRRKYWLVKRNCW